jgi:hypothetical protein
VIEALVTRENKPNLLPDARNIKVDAIARSVARHNAADDVKSAAGDIYVGLKQLLGLQRCGNTSEAFMLDTLATLFEPGMASYEKLKSAIVDRILLPT